MAMNTVETQAFVKKSAVEALNLAGATQIDDYTYALPIAIEGEAKPRYAKIAITCTNNKDTKTTDAFNLDTAVKAYAEKCEERKVKEAEKAAAKAAREAKRNSKSKK